MMTLREMMIEYILFANSDEDLAKRYLTEEDLPTLSDVDLLELYDSTLLEPINE